MATYNHNNGFISVNDPNIKSLDKNSGNLEVTRRSCRILSVNSNHGLISVAEFSLIAVIERNSGMIDLMRGINVGSINRNSGSIDIKDNCAIDMVTDNTGFIQLGNNCVIKTVVGNGGIIQCGRGCHVPAAVDSFPKPQNSSVAFSIGDCETIQIFNHEHKSEQHQSMPQLQSQQHQSLSQFKSQQDPSAAPQNQTTPQQTAANEELLCDICMENKKDTAFNCGHTCCGNCAITLCDCHICRAQIVQRIKFFL